MKIEWVNHASFVLQYKKIRLMSDPWLEGYAFDRGWALLSQTKFSYDDFASITHIWFSHEHPDHFAPPNLKKIDPKIREQIIVLFQQTQDKRVVNFCRDLGFKDVIEMSNDWYFLDDDLKILCQPVGRGDSWLAIKSPEYCILNINDCIYMSEEELVPLKEQINRVDVLLTQFSYASWWGNKEEDHLWQKAARDTLEKINREIKVLDPNYVLLCASFVYFCHEENVYMNKHINTVNQAYNFIATETETTPIVLYPGDYWKIGEPHISQVALEHYLADHNRALINPILVQSSKIDIQKLFEESVRFVYSLKQNNSFILLRKLPYAKIYLTDYKESLELTLQGFKHIQCEYENHDIALSSNALLYCLQFPWGGETLKINGRFQTPVKGNNYNFFHWCSIASSNSRGTYYNIAYYVGMFLAKFRKLIP